MKRSKHNLSYYKLLTGNMGNLIPIGWFDVLPGDSIQQKTHALLRFAPLLAPVMHPTRVRIHHFFVPIRTIWEDFEEFITGGEDGDQAPTAPTVPIPATTGFAEGSRADYLGIDPGIDGSAAGTISALPFRAYNAIYNEWFRDEQLISPLAISVASGVDSTTNLDLQRVAWGRDRFTKARPEPILGTEVMVPITGDADVILNSTTGISPRIVRQDNHVVVDSPGLESAASGNLNQSGGLELAIDPNGTLLADGADLGIAIQDLRRTAAIFRFQEARNLFGGRYPEYLRYLGVNPADSRLDIPEYLGGGMETIQFSEVLQTAPNQDTGTSEDVGVAELKGHGISTPTSNRYRYYAQEHGIIMSFMSVVPKTIYTQGIHKSWARFTKYDYWQKEFETIGQQEILNRELNALHTSPLGGFGWEARYEDYRSVPSNVAGEFRSTLNYWHLGRELPTNVALNADFINCTPRDDIFASTATDQMYIMANHSIQARRLLRNTMVGRIL